MDQAAQAKATAKAGSHRSAAHWRAGGTEATGRPRAPTHLASAPRSWGGACECATENIKYCVTEKIKSKYRQYNNVGSGKKSKKTRYVRVRVSSSELAHYGAADLA